MRRTSARWTATPAPDAADELMLYQTLVGAWPLGLAPRRCRGAGGVPRADGGVAGKGGARGQAPQRVGGAERGLRGGLPRFPGGVPGCRRARPRWRARSAPLPRASPLPGAVNALAQTLLRLTAPGRARPLPGVRVLGLLAGRSRQSPAGGFRRARRCARRQRRPGRPAGALAGRPGEAGADRARARAARAPPGVVRRRRLSPAARRKGRWRRICSRSPAAMAAVAAIVAVPLMSAGLIARRRPGRDCSTAD